MDFFAREIERHLTFLFKQSIQFMLQIKKEALPKYLYLLTNTGKTTDKLEF
jgi:hypothetical protein